LVATGYLHMGSGLYVLDKVYLKEGLMAALSLDAAIAEEVPLDLALLAPELTPLQRVHQKLGHLHVEGIKELVKQGKVHDITPQELQRGR
ncbi:hypothetical protein LW959_17845, partial [Erwinia amylovora]|uniref:hypothetical protein n=1 Tax=Erwinia amylovora TaxID=552 RepID=UPI0020BD7403